MANPCCGPWNFLFLCFFFFVIHLLLLYHVCHHLFMPFSWPVYTQNTYLFVMAGMSNNALAIEMCLKIFKLEDNWTWRSHLHSYFIAALLWDAVIIITQDRHKKAWELIERHHFLKYPSEFLLGDRNLFYFCFYSCSLYVSIGEKSCTATFLMYFFLLHM